MARPDKTAAVAEIAEAFRTSSAAVLTEYRGLTVKQLTALRRTLGDGSTYTVVKNTLTKIAAKDAGLTGLDDLLQGPTAIAFSTGDPVEMAKGVRDFAKANPALVIKGGVLDGKALTADEIRKLADLESREVLLSKLAGAMLASLSQAASLFQAPLSKAVRTAEALRVKAEADPSILAGGAGTPAPVAEAPAADVTEAVAEDTTEAPADVVAEDATEAPAEAVADSTETSTESSTDAEGAETSTDAEGAETSTEQ